MNIGYKQVVDIWNGYKTSTKVVGWYELGNPPGFNGRCEMKWPEGALLYPVSPEYSGGRNPGLRATTFLCALVATFHNLIPLQIFLFNIFWDIFGATSSPNINLYQTIILPCLQLARFFTCVKLNFVQRIPMDLERVIETNDLTVSNFVGKEIIAWLVKVDILALCKGKGKTNPTLMSWVEAGYGSYVCAMSNLQRRPIHSNWYLFQGAMENDYKNFSFNAQTFFV